MVIGICMYATSIGLVLLIALIGVIASSRKINTDTLGIPVFAVPGILAVILLVTGTLWLQKGYNLLLVDKLLTIQQEKEAVALLEKEASEK